MIKYIIFDLDGTLVDTSQFHFDALNKAIKDYSPQCVVPLDKKPLVEGMTTFKRLEVISKINGLPTNLHKVIHHKKQIYTVEGLKLIQSDNTIRYCIGRLSLLFIIDIASNCIRESANTIVERLKIETYVKNVYSSNDVINPKPDPEIYNLAMKNAGFEPHETLIVEDSEVGLRAAKASGANYVKVDGPQDIEFLKMVSYINQFRAKDTNQ